MTDSPADNGTRQDSRRLRQNKIFYPGHLHAPAGAKGAIAGDGDLGSRHFGGLHLPSMITACGR